MLLWMIQTEPPLLQGSWPSVLVVIHQASSTGKRKEHPEGAFLQLDKHTLALKLTGGGMEKNTSD
jgi:hypothetical protein